jgi:hypothetical protein
VHYLENNLFESGERPHCLNYLMSFTDFIEIENALSVSYEYEANVEYRYTVIERLVIKHQRGSDRTGNPPVYEETVTLKEVREQKTGRAHSFGGYDEPGGVFYIDPQKYIDAYRHFVGEQYGQMTSRDMESERTLYFSADLVVEFNCIFICKERRFNQTLTRTVTIPLSMEVYDIEIDGTPSFELADTPIRDFQRQPLYVVIPFVLWMALNIFGITYGARHLMAEKNTTWYEARRILKEYADEIVTAQAAFDLSAYEIVKVGEFKDLLKLAISAGKQVLLYDDNEKMDFFVLVDHHAYLYRIGYAMVTVYETESINEMADEVQCKTLNQ